MKRALLGALIGGGIALAGAGVATAAETSGDDGLLSGTQAVLSLDAPVTVAGNAVSVLGDSSSHDASTTVGEPAAPAGDASTGGADGILDGSQALVDVSAPVTVSGNAVSLVGDSTSSDAHTTVAGPDAESESEPPEASTSGDDGILGGTQALIGLDVPVTVSGNAVSVIGDSASHDATTSVANGSGSEDADATTSGDESVLGGTQLITPISAPVTIAGNAVSVIGDSTTDGATTDVGSGSGTGDATTSGDDGILGGTQLIAPISAPVTIAGNAVSVIGDSTTDGATTDVGSGSGTGDATTSGNDGILGGTQLIALISIPVTIAGNAVSVIGDSTTDGSTTVVTPTEPSTPTEPGTPGDPGTPGAPGNPGTTRIDGTTGIHRASAVPVSFVAAAATAPRLATTGSDIGALPLVLGVLLLLGGGLLRGLRRRAA